MWSQKADPPTLPGRGPPGHRGVNNPSQKSGRDLRGGEIAPNKRLKANHDAKPRREPKRSPFPERWSHFELTGKSIGEWETWYLFQRVHWDGYPDYFENRDDRKVLSMYEVLSSEVLSRWMNYKDSLEDSAKNPLTWKLFENWVLNRIPFRFWSEELE